ncbi:MAG TPA: type 1 glutamine amidotransferase, partial [Planctomycetaceae bacterium]|nr:type 1 glutamine amidotransferase [Planctomycetaceae bacterium]
FLLFQVRNADDPMRRNEVQAFARALQTEPERIAVVDLLSERADEHDFQRADMFLFGGSGHYSAAGEGKWLQAALDLMREIHRLAKPTFASCWGFQAMARALGGRVVHDLERAELGTRVLYLTDEGRRDPVFGPLGPSFLAHMGHEDRVAELPAGATRLAFTPLVDHQAYRIEGRPIYCTQFHPELNREDLLARVRSYPEYVEKIAGVTIDEFAATIQDTPQAATLLKRFVETVFG